MAFNIFKKSASSADAPTRRKEKDIVKETPKIAVVGAKKATRKSIGVSALSLPHITEKAGMLQEQNQYVFRVVPGATKYAVRNSVQAQYGVEVEKVRMISVPSKSIRVGRRMGKKPGYKKAVVTLKEGDTIELGA